ncbi:variant erythrocyte surface antigen-1 family protein [Babesia caballi]|uniref:Variant erythrocyte surface antigen-1 family protein n=1 Tax=Babesia caballi TaxID=5871 RepID=A0AAV4LRA9_BABCB|nr:variant erythrocyte surface antigen-1 family protein [Babesia caballi]
MLQPTSSTSYRGYPFIHPSRPLFSLPSNLKEAIYWILRATGKDGGGGDGSSVDGAEQLAKAITEMPGFTDAINAAADKLNESGSVDVSQALKNIANSTTLEEIIKKLAEGLRTFIGYQSGTIKHGSTGIGLPNDPRERLGDAVLGFLYGFLDLFDKAVKSGRFHDVELTDVTPAELKMSMGKGGEDFDTAVQKMAKLSDSKSKISNIVNTLKTFSKLSGKIDGDLKTFASSVSKYLGDVIEAVAGDSSVTSAKVQGEVNALKNSLTALVEQLKNQSGPIDQSNNSQVMTKIKRCYESFNSLSKTFPKLTNQLVARALVYASYNATSNFLAQLQTGYKSSYQGATTQALDIPQAPETYTCAKIFLSCLPLIFSNLQHLYWKCKQENNQGGWKQMLLNGSGGQGTDLKHFMDLMTFSSVRLNGTMTGEGVESVMKTSFAEFFTAASSRQSYAGFLTKFKTTGIDKWKTSRSTASNTNFLSGLYLCSSWYFHGCQAKISQTRPPSSIREMLYWFSGLQFVPGYSDLENQIENVVTKEGLSVAISGSPNSDEKLTADQVTEYLVTACLYSPTVFCNIQEPGISENAGEPWLHSLYSNSEFNFTYPSSGSSLLYKVADYAYALQFQLGFLYKQCTHIHTNTCGWYMCQFGKSVNVNVQDGAILSHICPAGCSTSGHGTGDHAEGDCQHAGCGQEAGKPSPLQAFLTDKLPGFSLPTATNKLTYSDGHMVDHTPGSMCHVQMGFDSTKLRSSGMGAHIKFALQSFCGSHNTPLRQLCGTLTCLSKRAPRSLGDLFGFYWQVTGQLFNDVKNKDKDPTSSLTGAITTLLSKLTTVRAGLLYESLSTTVESIGSHFFGLSWHCHRKNQWKTEMRTGPGYCDDHSNSKKARDLMSLYDSECTQNSATCGKYLESLGISYGATFANNYAFMYLSWAAYFTDDLYESLQEFLEKLNIHACKGCKHNCSHTSASQCQCASVVDCADVLPLLYSNGFNFKDAFSLKGMEWQGQTKKTYTQTAASKRNCKAFADQLQSVIAGNPLSNLLTSIDYFLFLFRYYFLSNLSAFWTIYICLILYTFFFLLDTLHLRSHVKLTSSHTVPPLSLLTSGNPLPITKLTYIGK